MNRSDKFALATLLPLLALSALMQVLAGGNGDKGWLLLATRLWLAGKQLYVGVVEINPPFIIWFYAMPVWLSQHVRIFADYQFLGLMGLMMSAFCVGLSLYLMRLHPMFEHDRRRQSESALLLCAIFVFLTPQTYFFDREHVLYVLTFPYVLRFTPGLALKQPQRWLRIAISLTAGAGFCVKPHAMILFMAVQLLFMLFRRSAAILWSAENLIIYVIVASYLCCVWHFTPEYLHFILPMALETYTAFGRNGSALLCLPTAVLCVALTFADFRTRYTSPYRGDIYYFIGVAAAFLIHALVSNGWDYTYHPLLCTLVLLAGLVLYEYQWLQQECRPEGSTDKGFVFGMRGCAICLASQGIYMALLVFTSLGVFLIQAKCARNPQCELQDVYIRYVHDNDVHSFGTITQDYPKWVRLVQFSGAQWETRFNHLWMIPKLLQETEGPPASHAWILPYVAGALAADLNERKPQIVFVDIGRQFTIYPKYIDLIGFLSQVPQFKAAWGAYRYTTTIDECGKQQATIFKTACKYAIYNRLPSSSGQPS